MPLSRRCDELGDLDQRLIPLFAEVQLRCPLGICVERERTRSTGLAPPGVYAQAGQPGSAVPGVDLPYAESFLGVKRVLYRLMGVRIGAGVAVSGNMTFDIFFPELIEVGENAIIGYGATILSHEFLRKELRVGRVRIGRDVLIGANATMLPGVVIGDGAIISAMSLVHKDMGPGEFGAGVPLKRWRRREPDTKLTSEGG